MRTRSILSPLAALTVLLLAFELVVRLPYVLAVAGRPEYGQWIQVHLFSVYPPGSVISVGLIILAAAAAAALMAVMFGGPAYDRGALVQGLPRVPRSLYPVSLFFFAAVILSIQQLGHAAIVEDISGKRSGLGDRGVMYVLLKAGNFCHLIACLYYIRIHQVGSVLDKIGFAVSVLLLTAATVVFSQRAILIAFVLEIVYLQLIFGTFSLKRIVKISSVVVPAMLLISILRPSAAVMGWGEAAVFGLERLMQSRYFFEFTKLGAVALWAAENDWLGPVSIAFLFEPFMPDSVMFYKEVGPLIAREVYFYNSENGITPGALLEAVLSFGLIGGIAFFGVLLYAFLRAERSLLTTPRSLGSTLFLLLVVSKFSLLLNSSLGAFSFQVVLESVFLVATLAALSALAGLVPARAPERNLTRSVEAHRPIGG